MHLWVSANDEGYKLRMLNARGTNGLAFSDISIVQGPCIISWQYELVCQLQRFLSRLDSNKVKKIFF